MLRSPDVIVVGAGAVGTAVAYYTAAEGLATLLLERQDVAAFTSGACDGFLGLQTKRLGPQLDFAVQSLALYQAFEDEWKREIEFRQCGGLLLLGPSDDADTYRARARQFQTQGVSLRELDREQLLNAERHLGPAVVAGWLCEAEAQVNPWKVCLAFLRRFLAAGGEVKLHTPVTYLPRSNGRIIGVRTAQEEIHSALVVLACGVHTSALLAPLGIALPLQPVRGQVLVTEPLPPVLNHTLVTATDLATKWGEPPSVAAPPVGSLKAAEEAVGGRLPAFCAEQTASGNLLLGLTREAAGLATCTTPEGLGRLARAACTVLPLLSGVNVIRTFAGLRPTTPDGLPLIGPAPGCEGLLLCAGHGGDGICLAPASGLAVARLLKGAAPPPAEFRPDRFVA